jgi:hypothetical protein
VLHLGHAPSPKVLGAKSNCIGDEGAGHAAELPAASTALRRLDLVRNGITAAGVAMLAEAMQLNERLIVLGLDASLPEAVLTRLARSREVCHGPHSAANGAWARATVRPAAIVSACWQRRIRVLNCRARDTLRSSVRASAGGPLPIRRLRSPEDELSMEVHSWRLMKAPSGELYL